MRYLLTLLAITLGVTGCTKLPSDALFKVADENTQMPQCALPPPQATNAPETSKVGVYEAAQFLISSQNKSAQNYFKKISHLSVKEFSLKKMKWGDEKRKQKRQLMAAVTHNLAPAQITPTGANDYAGTLLPAVDYNKEPLPANFDLREAYPQCKNIGAASSQGLCGDCWAHATARAISEQFCVQSINAARKTTFDNNRNSFQETEKASLEHLELATLELSPQNLVDCGIAYNNKFLDNFKTKYGYGFPLNIALLDPKDDSAISLFGCMGGLPTAAYQIVQAQGLPTANCRKLLFNTQNPGSLAQTGTCAESQCGCAADLGYPIAKPENEDHFVLQTNAGSSLINAAISNPAMAPKTCSENTPSNPTLCSKCTPTCDDSFIPYKNYQIKTAHFLDLTLQNGPNGDLQIKNNWDTDIIPQMKKAILTYGSITITMLPVPMSLIFYSGEGILTYTGWQPLKIKGEKVSCGGVKSNTTCQTALKKADTDGQFVAELKAGVSEENKSWDPNMGGTCLNPDTQLPCAGGNCQKAGLPTGICGIVDPASDGHALRIIGWGQEESSRKNYWIVTNSWGPAWGDKGSFKLDMDEPTTRNLLTPYFFAWSEVNLDAL